MEIVTLSRSAVPFIVGPRKACAGDVPEISVGSGARFDGNKCGSRPRIRVNLESEIKSTRQIGYFTRFSFLRNRCIKTGWNLWSTPSHLDSVPRYLRRLQATALGRPSARGQLTNLKSLALESVHSFVPEPLYFIPLVSRRLENSIPGRTLFSSSTRAHPVESEMCIGMEICEDLKIEDAKLLAYGAQILSEVPGNIIFTPDRKSGLNNGGFLGFKASESKYTHSVPIGVFKGLRFMCCFRFKLWWMTQRMGSLGMEVPLETQFMLVESTDSPPFGDDMDCRPENNSVYTVFLPLLEGAFRTSLQGNEKNEIELCVESGDPVAQTSEGLHSVYINTGYDPFEVITGAVRAVESHMQSFTRRENKRMPGILDYFGWCTWDAFYTDVTAEGVMEGLKSLAEGGAPARFLIIDDGWQSVAADKPVDVTVTEGTQYSSRLTNIKENQKFLKDGKSFGLHHIVPEVKNKFDVKYVYVWHALAGYWGGVQPDGEGMEQYESVVTYPVHSPGILGNQPDMAIDSLTVNGLGLVNPKKVADFFNELHGYLRTAGIDGVKVDAQSILETLGAGFGGRVSITKQFNQALEESIAKNFPDNGCIACMCHNTDSIYSSKQTAVVRASDDFWPKDPASHTIHIASVAYNTLFLGEFMQPDWDMFHSLHPAAEYHAAARAVGGCSVYVSDKPGNHDFDLLRKIVLPDGRVLRAQLPGRPTRDCLFTDPARDGVSLLKIWNLNLFGGVVGAFNCQGAGWCKVNKKNAIHDTAPKAITGSVHASDVDSLAKVAVDGWKGDCVVYTHRGGELIRLPRGAAIPLTLKVLEFEIFSISPIKTLAPGMFFAPIGLINMFNSGGAIETLGYEILEHDLLNMYNMSGDSEPIEGLNENMTWSNDFSQQATSNNTQVPLALVRMKIRGCGLFGAYSSKRPRLVFVNSEIAEFTYDFQTGFLKLDLPISKTGESWDLIIEV
ncbi:raffinose synthase [Marchantia polymorpha subsp. ruderalis]|uniref:galactinol--sucrose galactosyltransferase n=2 Tax=Marchantia polymorpha TaxID=3197 RepID=A0AAF6B2P3_MARPO|nr:hypothetical protein MARPO_0049s0057 [Marchantia polymorpha]BBN06277.1 hypothetical protein Mp_3g19770 [Marchantia polymorpha subsp. ruderalis]|eukprot:PTQ38766.1 hypothetical protein MARPO_0049s0057 [Marchantia polymorpha]